MTYNVRYFGHASKVVRGAASTKTAVRGITDAIARLDKLPHVICLQEVEAQSLRSTLSHSKNETQLDAVMETLEWSLNRRQHINRYFAHYFPAHTYKFAKAKIYTTGLAILTRDDLQVDTHDAAPHDITHRRNGFIAKVKQSRICAHVTVRRGDDTVDVFNTHLSLPAFMSKDMLRIISRMGYGKNQQQEIEALAKYVKKRKSSSRYIIAGDFNSLPGSPAYDLLMDRLKVRDPFPEVLGHSMDHLRTAWPTAGFFRFKMRLDHIFAGPGLRWIDFDDSHPYGETDGHWHELSDHVPIVGRFALERKPPGIIT